MSPGHLVSKTPRYHPKFPQSFFAVSRTRTSAVSPKCDRSVTRTPITVFRGGTPRWHLQCTGSVDSRCTASVHRGFIHDVPRYKPDGFLHVGKSLVHPGCPGLTHLGFTSQVHSGCPEGGPARYTAGTPQPEPDAGCRFRVSVRAFGMSWFVWVLPSLSLSV